LGKKLKSQGIQHWDCFAGIFKFLFGFQEMKIGKHRQCVMIMTEEEKKKKTLEQGYILKTSPLPNIKILMN